MWSKSFSMRGAKCLTNKYWLRTKVSFAKKLSSVSRHASGVTTKTSGFRRTLGENCARQFNTGVTKEHCLFQALG